MSTKGFEEGVLLSDERKEERRFRKEPPRLIQLDQRNYSGPNEAAWSVDIPQDEMTLLVAPGGTGKSWMFLYWANKLSKDPSKRVMLWLGEDDATITYSRLCLLDANYKELEYPPDNLEFIWETGKPLYQAERFTMDQVDAKGEKKRITASDVNPTEEMTYLEKRIAAFKPDILFLDPLSVLGPIGFETDNEVCAKFVIKMRKQFKGLTVIASHHANKAGGNDAASSRGSSALIDGFRHAFTLSVFERLEVGEDALYLKTVKANYVEKVNTFYIRKIRHGKTTIEIMTPAERDAMFDQMDEKEVQERLGEDAGPRKKKNKGTASASAKVSTTSSAPSNPYVKK